MNKKMILLGGAIVVLSGCDTLKNTFGLDHYQADEYSIPTTPPLSMPPDYNLKAPDLQAKPRGHVSTKKKAQEALGAPADAQSKETEEELLKKAETGQSVDPHIRELVDSEAKEDKTVRERLSNLGKEAAENLSGQGGNLAEPKASKSNPAQTR
jgi:Protein of unknown function (DUF3035)